LVFLCRVIDELVKIIALPMEIVFAIGVVVAIVIVTHVWVWILKRAAATGTRSILQDVFGGFN
jgi:hypothetical protein